MAAASKVTTALTQPTRGHPATFLIYAFLQSLGAGLTVLPILFLFRDIARKRCQSLAPPDLDPCNAATIYTPPVIVYFSIVSILGLLVTGPFGKLVDAKGRKAAMTAIGLLHCCGDIWLYLCGK